MLPALTNFTFSVDVNNIHNIHLELGLRSSPLHNATRPHQNYLIRSSRFSTAHAYVQWRETDSDHGTAVTIGHVRLNTYGRQVAGLMAWNSAPDFIQDPTTAQTVLGVYLKCTCSRDTSASSASGVLNDSVLYKSTHSLALCALDAA